MEQYDQRIDCFTPVFGERRGLGNGPRAVFLAEPVRMGDSFILRRNGHVVAIDGGVGNQDHSHLVKLTKGGPVDVLVCTHADDDHISGTTDILCTPGARELWVPADWASLVRTIYADRTPIAERLTKDLRRLLRRHVHQAEFAPVSAADALEGLGPFFPPDARVTKQRSERPEEHRRARRESPRSPDLSAQLPHDIPDAVKSNPPQLPHDLGPLPLELDMLLVRLGYGPLPGGHTSVDLARQDVWSLEGLDHAVVKAAIGAIHRIVLLLWLARARNACVRLFAYEPTALVRPDPIRHGLLPINSKEVTHIPAGPKTLLEATYLTVVNRRSLVFAAPPDNQCYGVLFCGDSDLDFLDSFIAGNAWSDLIVTAPHHGSHSNSDAYERIERVLVQRPFRWVRSDKPQKQRPCTAYLQRPRACTRCGNRPAEVVRFDSQAKTGWTPSEGDSCMCP